MNIFEISQEYFCCPICKGELKIDRIGQTADGLLECMECQHKYIVMHSIPIMLPYGYVETGIRERFLQMHPDYRVAFEGLNPVVHDDIKQHQIKTWGAQYSDADIAFPASRTIPQTRDVFVRSVFYKNSRKLLYDVILSKRERDNEVFLDIGCGQGAFTHFGTQNFKLYFGLDISFEAILRCYSSFPFKNSIFLVGDAESLPLRNASANVCAAQWLFEHLGNPQKCANEISRVLSNRGNAYIDTNHRNFLFTYRWFQMVFTPKKYWRRMEEAGHSHDRFFDKDQIQKIFKQADFTRINTRLCFFLMDMLISKKIMSPMFKTIGKFVGRQNPNLAPTRGKDKQFVELIDFDKKTEFISLRSRKDYLIKAFNFFMTVLYHFLFLDRLLELCGIGESVILITEKAE